YNRVAQPTALVIGAALAALAVAPALAVAGTPFNASSFTGAIMIFGMVLTNGIVLMDMIDAEVHDGRSLAEAIVAAGARRVRPVLMTASIAVLALLPLAFGIGAGAEMQKPLAVAVIGGLAVSPAVTLFVLPALLLLIRREPRGVTARGAAE